MQKRIVGSKNDRSSSDFSMIFSLAILRLKSMGNVTKTFEQGLDEIT
jgi:hypothetical protein